MRISIVSVLMCLFSAVQAAEFELVVSYDGEHMRVECRSGCNLPMPTFPFADRPNCLPNDCVVAVRDGSMSIAPKPTGASASLVTDSPDYPKFEIRLMPTGSGVNAQCSPGCGWQEESFSCPNLPCVATIDELGIRLGDVAVNDWRTAYEKWSAQQDPRRQWVDCLVRYTVRARADGGPAVYGVVRKEAQAACEDYRSGWDDWVKMSGSSPAEAEETVDAMLRKLWESGR